MSVPGLPAKPQTIVLAIISAITTITVAAIPFVKDLRPEDQSPTLSVTGRVARVGDLTEPFEGELYLLRATGNDLVAESDTEGKFVFSNVPPGHYFILVRDPNASLGRGLINATIPVVSEEVALKGVAITLSIGDEER